MDLITGYVSFSLSGTKTDNGSVSNLQIEVRIPNLLKSNKTNKRHQLHSQELIDSKPSKVKIFETRKNQDCSRMLSLAHLPWGIFKEISEAYLYYSAEKVDIEISPRSRVV